MSQPVGPHPGGSAVYTISPGRPFADVLADSLLETTKDDPAALADWTVLLPTRRACRAISEAFLRRSEGRVVLLPRLSPLGDIDEDDLLFGGAASTGDGEDIAADGADALTLPPAISGIKRQALLARLILARDRAVKGAAEGPRSDRPGFTQSAAPRAMTPDQALRLAAELARLLDQVATEGLDFDRLADLVPEKLADHWQQTLDFLTLLTGHWPEILEAEGAVDPATRRNLLLEARARTWSEKPPAHPVIAAGSTGSIPATAGLLAAIAALPKGAVILPGLDQDADDTVWNALAPSHPQFGLKRLLGRLGIHRDAVAEWAPEAASDLRKGPPARRQLLEAAVTPAALTGEPPLRRLAQDIAVPDALDGLKRADCASPAEEAEVIALAFREVLETPGRTAALVTPDRTLARRVAAEMARWGVRVDDSAGMPLDQTEAGTFLKLTAALAGDRFAPVALLSALRHPLARLGGTAEHVQRLISALEIHVLRGPRPAPGISGLRQALKAGPLAEHITQDLGTLLDTLESASDALSEQISRPETTLPGVIKAHVELAEALAVSETETGDQRLWAGEAGEAAAAFVADLSLSADALGPIQGRHYPALLETLMAGRPVRPRYGAHPRLAIWGLLEARLQRADLMILGGLNEGTWPPEAAPSPWMSRPMLKSFGLPEPERRIGLTAHDFQQAFNAPEVLITRAERADGTPTVPARWLQRLDNLLMGLGRLGGLPHAANLTQWAAALDVPKPEEIIPSAPPRPTPPVSARPRALSVTRVERWVRDPYAIFAETILRLKPLEPLDADPGAADRGTLIHLALERFVKAHPHALPENAEAALLAEGEAVFAAFADRPGVTAFWWPRFRRIARWFAGFEAARRRAGYQPLLIEAKGERTFEGPAGPFKITAAADRIDRRADGRLAILDYKTGQAPSWPQVETGLAPQLPLEAALAEAGGFTGLPPTPRPSVDEITYVKLSGGRTAGEAKIRDTDVADMIAATLEGLERRIWRFDQPETPYVPRLRPMFERFEGPYDHLARVLEWRSAGDGSGGNGGAGS